MSEIAEELHMNISYLSSQFKKETGQTITNFIQEKRIETEIKYLKSVIKQYETDRETTENR